MKKYVYVVVYSQVVDGHYVSENIRVTDSREAAIKCIEELYGDDFWLSTDDDFTYFYNGDETDDRIDIERWEVK